MKKFLFIFLFILAMEFPMEIRELGNRRLNESVLKQQHVYNSTIKIEILKGLSAYDYSQIEQNSGRLFIRDVIIHE